MLTVSSAGLDQGSVEDDSALIFTKYTRATLEEAAPPFFLLSMLRRHNDGSPTIYLRYIAAHTLFYHSLYRGRQPRIVTGPGSPAPQPPRTGVERVDAGAAKPGASSCILGFSFLLGYLFALLDAGLISPPRFGRAPFSCAAVRVSHGEGTLPGDVAAQEGFSIVRVSTERRDVKTEVWDTKRWKDGRLNWKGKTW